MNTPNPLIPQGSLQSKGKSTVRIAFFTIAAIHVVFIGGLLMQGCKKSEDQPVAIEETNALPPLPPIDLADPNIVDTNYAAPVVSNPPPLDIPPPAPVVEIPPPVVTPEPATREYVVMKGDSFSSIAQKTGTSVRAIEQANPGVNSSRLQIGQRLQIPAANETASFSSVNSSTPSNGGSTLYTVKAGDVLERIARRNGTTVKAIMSLNNMRTTTIRVGQKIKLPAKPEAATPEFEAPLPPAGTTQPIP